MPGYPKVNKKLIVHYSPKIWIITAKNETITSIKFKKGH